MAKTIAPIAERAQTGDVTILPVRRLSGVYTPPADKSISHRALILSAIATGKSTVTPLSRSEDVAATAACLRQLGVAIDSDGNRWVIESPGVNHWTAPERALDCGNSGTTMRLLAGCLAGGRFSSRLVGDPSLSRRPMARLAEPLQRMGANITLASGSVSPIEIVGISLRGIEYELPVASAQIKSAVLLAGLQASGNTSVIEPYPSRDHTERMLASAGVDCTVDIPRRPPGDWREQLLASDGDGEPDSPARRTVRLGLGRDVRPNDWTVPGDFSAAAFIFAAAIGVHKSDIIIADVGLNPSRTGFLRAVRRMGATVEVKPGRSVSGEPCGQIRLQSTAALKAIKVSAAEIPGLIDELPILAVLAARAEGVTVIRGAGELRHKESDRIATVTTNLRAMGVKVAELEDGWAIEGPTEWHAATIEPAGDHRIAMAFAVAALWADGPSTIHNAKIAAVSDPDFFDCLSALSR